jgi:uncharacterized membrane protein YkoI
LQRLDAKVKEGVRAAGVRHNLPVIFVLKESARHNQTSIKGDTNMHSRISRFIVAVLLTAGLATLASAKEEKEEKSLSVKDLPVAARATVEKLTTGGTVRKIDKEDENGKVFYDIEATVKGKDVEFDIAEDGTILVSEESVEYGSLPATVRAAVEKHFGSATGLKASKAIEKGATSYEVEGKKDGADATLTLDETGKIVEEEKAAKEEKKDKD